VAPAESLAVLESGLAATTVRMDVVGFELIGRLTAAEDQAVMLAAPAGAIHDLAVQSQREDPDPIAAAAGMDDPLAETKEQPHRHEDDEYLEAEHLQEGHHGSPLAMPPLVSTLVRADA